MCPGIRSYSGIVQQLPSTSLLTVWGTTVQNGWLDDYATVQYSTLRGSAPAPRLSLHGPECHVIQPQRQPTRSDEVHEILELGTGTFACGSLSA